MGVCLCYHDEKNFLHERGVCYGTKEKEPCSCGGNPVKCDFYEEVREKYTHRTNADRLRDMSDEELAEYLANICYDFWALFVDDPKKVWLGWLRQEVNG